MHSKGFVLTLQLNRVEAACMHLISFIHGMLNQKKGVAGRSGVDPLQTMLAGRGVWLEMFTLQGRDLGKFCQVHRRQEMDTGPGARGICPCLSSASLPKSQLPLLYMSRLV